MYTPISSNTNPLILVILGIISFKLSISLQSKTLFNNIYLFETSILLISSKEYVLYPTQNPVIDN